MPSASRPRVEEGTARLLPRTVEGVQDDAESRSPESAEPGPSVRCAGAGRNAGPLQQQGTAKARDRSAADSAAGGCSAARAVDAERTAEDAEAERRRRQRGRAEA